MKSHSFQRPQIGSEAKVHVRHYSPEKNWYKFQEKYGPGLVPAFSLNGHLLSIRGKFGEGARASSDFTPTDPRLALARAREILASARELLEIDPMWPLENAAVKSGTVSVQVYFSETHDGIPVAPAGGVKLDLGTHGELLGLYSEYVPHLRVTNQPVLDPEQAKAKVSEAFDNQAGQFTLPNFGLSLDGGGKVIWIVGSQADKVEGRIAYQFSIGGHQVVVDAETGTILSSKDNRHY